MIFSDITIESYCAASTTRKPMIEPFFNELQKYDVERFGENVRIPSFGLSSYGYDVRLQPKFKLFSKPDIGRVIDIFNFVEESHVEEIESDHVIIPPGGLLLGVTVEKFNMPPDVTGVCIGKSTWARIGAQVLVTPLEAGWSGELVVEITNATNTPLKIYAHVGIAQIQFLKGDRHCRVSYSDRGGKYDKQIGVTTAKL